MGSRSGKSNGRCDYCRDGEATNRYLDSRSSSHHFIVLDTNSGASAGTQSIAALMILADRTVEGRIAALISSVFIC